METIEITHLEERYNIDVKHTNENLSGFFTINWDNPILSEITTPPIRIYYNNNYNSRIFNIPEGNLDERTLLLSIIQGIVTNDSIKLNNTYNH